MPGPGAYLIGDEEYNEVVEVLKSKHISRYGSDDDPLFRQKVHTLEREFAEHMNAQYSVAVNSGTSALMASLIALGIGRGDEVLVPGYTFIASMSSIIAVGGTPVLVEVDESLTMDPADIESRITKKTKAVMPVHMLGNPCNMKAICDIAHRHELSVVEDCCQALGGSFQGKKLGTWGKIGAYSLNVYKVISAGDAGILITDDKSLYERAFGFHDQGHLPRRKGVEIGNRSLIGINMRMNELTGAFALAQLRKLDRILELLREKKARFKKAISDAGLKGMHFRTINDPGECGTLLTVIFENAEQAEKAASALGTKTLNKSGWHVYNNMEQMIAWRDENGNAPIRKNMLPQTDNILSRSLNLSVGVVDGGIGSDFGITILSDENEIDGKAEEFIKRIKPVTG
ncbi:MAG TPA: DegT/DnrJ/EryC1/StrS family aminotransferase [Desulfomonilia bacterium]